MPPPIKVRGVRQVIPPGYILGRLRGSGDVELLNLRDLRQFGVATKAEHDQATKKAGFGFFAGGLLDAGETLGTGAWAHEITFSHGDPDTLVTARFAATATAVLLIKTIVAGVETTGGTITFNAGSTNGVVAFIPALVVPAATQLKLYAPAVADATLAEITGIVTGSRA